MGMTRRGFLISAAGVATMALPLDVSRRGRPSLVVLLDLKDHCSLRESAWGYQSALTGVGTRFTRADAQSVPRCAMLIVPAALAIPPAAARAIVTCLRAGASVILESGAGFANEPDFRAHRVVLRDSLQIHIEAPVQLWSARTRGIPYVDYTWPSPSKVRDFSRVVPLGPQTGEIIASVDGLPVALKRRSGRGTLIFLA
jgi:hypothetical protein